MSGGGTLGLYYLSHIRCGGEQACLGASWACPGAPGEAPGLIRSPPPPPHHTLGSLYRKMRFIVEALTFLLDCVSHILCCQWVSEPSYGSRLACPYSSVFRMVFLVQLVVQLVWGSCRCPRGAPQLVRGRWDTNRPVTVQGTPPPFIATPLTRFSRTPA